MADIRPSITISSLAACDLLPDALEVIYPLISYLYLGRIIQTQHICAAISALGSCYLVSLEPGGQCDLGVNSIQGCYDENQSEEEDLQLEYGGPCRLDHFEGKKRKRGLATSLQVIDWEGDGDLPVLVPEKCSS